MTDLHPTKQVVAYRGDTLACHVCKFEVAEIRRDIYFGEEIEASMFRSKTNREIRSGDTLTCPKCGESLLAFGVLFFIHEGKNKNAPKLSLPEPV